MMNNPLSLSQKGNYLNPTHGINPTVAHPIVITDHRNMRTRWSSIQGHQALFGIPIVYYQMLTLQNHFQIPYQRGLSFMKKMLLMNRIKESYSIQLMQPIIYL